MYTDDAPGFWLNRQYVQDYEEGLSYPVRTTRGTFVPFIFVVVLHEAVHWADSWYDRKHRRWKSTGRRCVEESY
jgi:hypothetical protein